MKKLYFYIFPFVLGGLLTGNGTKISSSVFYEYSLSNNGYESGAFEVNRAYLTYNKKINDQLDLKMQTDVGRLKNDTDNRHLFLYLKNAKLDYKTGLGVFTFGLQGMNIFNIQEKNWGYRFIEKAAMDRYKYASSADLGLGFATQLPGKVRGKFMITNGSGYKKPETDDHKKFSLQLYHGNAKLSSSRSFNVGGIVSFENYDTSVEKVGSRTIFGGFGGLKSGSLRIGGEYNVLLDSEISDRGSILAGYGEISLNSNLKVFGRLDRSWTGENMTDYLIAGIRIHPADGLDIAPNLRIEGGFDPTYALNFQFKY